MNPRQFLKEHNIREKKIRVQREETPLQKGKDYDKIYYL
jgi:hypothetical protein